MAASAEIRVLSIAMCLVLAGCGTATSPAPDARAQLSEYREARDAICRQAAEASPVPNEHLLAVDVLYEPTMSADDRANSIVAVRALVDRFGATAGRLETIEAPPELAFEHVASVTRARDVVTLLGRLADYLGTGDLTAARVLDDAIGLINVKIEAYEEKYSLSPCP